jgi:hypothetical protein
VPSKGVPAREETSQLGGLRRRSSTKRKKSRCLSDTVDAEIKGDDLDAKTDAYSVCLYFSNWCYIATVLFEIVHVPFRLSFFKSEEDIVWFVIGFGLDAIKLHRLLEQIRFLMSGLYGISCSSAAIDVTRGVAQLLPLIPYNSIACVLLMSGWFEDSSQVWPLRMVQFSTWLALQGIYGSLELWSFEQNSRVTKLFRLLSCVCGILVIFHCCGCIWFFMGRTKSYEEDDEGCTGNFDALLPVCTWGPHEPLISQGIWVQYVFSVYWSVLVLMSGASPYYAQSFDEAIITSTMIFIGVLVNACLISVLGGILIDSDSPAYQRSKKMDAIDKFLDCHQMPPELRHKIKEFHLYQWCAGALIPVYNMLLNVPTCAPYCRSRTQGIDPQPFISAMPVELADDINAHTYSELLASVPIIKDAPAEFKLDLCRQFTSVWFHPEATVLKVPRVQLRIRR